MSPPSLLLLPQPPTPISPICLSAAYRAPLTSILRKLVRPSSLTIALASPLLHGAAPRRKTLAWAAAQSLLAGLYALVAVVLAEEGIDADVGADEGVDVRVVLVDHERGRRYEQGFEGGFDVNNTAVLDLAAFATRVRPWAAVYHPSCEAGYELLAAFLRLAEGKQTFTQSQLVAVEGGISMTTPSADDDEKLERTQGFNTVCLGGTFDHLHPGHKLLLHASLLLLNIPAPSSPPCTLIIGISGDALLTNKKYASELQPWPQRVHAVLSVLSTLLDYDTSATPAPTSTSADEVVATLRDGAVRVRCVNLRDAFGPTVEEEHVDVLVVSGETRGGGVAINEKRREKGWRELRVFEIDVLDARGEGGGEGFEGKISSTVIRRERAERKKM